MQPQLRQALPWHELAERERHTEGAPLTRTLTVAISAVAAPLEHTLQPCRVRLGAMKEFVQPEDGRELRNRCAFSLKELAHPALE